MAGNMPLPRVEVTGDALYVLASTYPNGPVCVATEGRVSLENQWYEPRATVTIDVADASQPIGVFGHYDTLVLNFPEPITDRKHVWVQDLLAESATDIRSRVSINGHQLSIPGEIIAQIDSAAADSGDVSVPGSVIQFER